MNSTLLTDTTPSPPALKSDEDIIMQYMGEIPNKAAAIVALSCYLLITFMVLWVTLRTRAWFMLTVVVTGFLEAAGFGARLFFMISPSMIAYTQTQCFLIISPVLLAIVEYVCLGKLLKLSAAGRSSHLARWVAVLFTISDILCLALQGAGGGALSTADEASAELGRKLLLVGLFLQLFFFTLFTLLVIHVQRSERYGFRANARFYPVFWCLYSTIALMYVRNIFRVIEFAQGFRGYLATHEVFFYMFDFVPLFFCFVLFTVLHYGKYLGQSVEELPLDSFHAIKVPAAHSSPCGSEVALVVPPVLPQGKAPVLTPVQVF
mmetsp:Transcript_28830/g.63520  ORF Transcript_28830/g.63520 Transcript_28830/m.63520 type:complete len:320 (-) Transcript_28830:905-1864(-)